MNAPFDDTLQFDSASAQDDTTLLSPSGRTDGTAAITNVLASSGRTAADDRPRHADNVDNIDQARLEIARIRSALNAYEAALERHAIVAVTNRAGRIVHANQMFCAVSGYEYDELIGCNHRIVNSGHHPRQFFVDMWRTIVRGLLWRGEICNRAKNGEIYWVDTTIVPLTDANGRIEAYVSIRFDITRRKLAETTLIEEVERRREAEALLTDVIETIPDAVSAFNTKDELVLFNNSYREMLSNGSTGVSLGEKFETILRRSVEDNRFIMPRNSPKGRESWLRARLKEHANPGGTSVCALADGRWIQSRERRSSSGYTVGIRTDITELKRSERAIKFHAEHDSLTGLLNRSVLTERLSDAVHSSVRSGRQGALVILDLDDFKGINDTMGHSAGDLLLQGVAERLTECVRKSDTVVRLGGDEFAIILPDVGGRTGAAKIARRLLAHVQRPAEVQRYTITPHLSLGVALFPRDGRKPGGLLKNADVALYRAKEDGRSTFRLFTRAMRAEIEQERKIANALSASVATDAIAIALQPQFTLAKGEHSGFETLARWTHNGVPVSPERFIPVAEETGLIVDLGRQVIEKSLDLARDWQRSDMDFGRLAINVSARQLNQPEFADYLVEVTKRHAIRPQRIELEITENVLLDQSIRTVAENMQKIRGHGFTIALDDFGTGYASLAHLTSFPVSRIKIDRSFVTDLASRPDALTIVQATTGLAHSLGMTVVAEGIETAEELERLKQCRCDYGQGYLVSRPLDPLAASRYLERGRRPDFAASETATEDRTGS